MRLVKTLLEKGADPNARITDSAIVSAAVLSDRYITDRFLPDKAIDLIDEAAASLRMEMDSLPVDIEIIERQIIQLEIERQALSKEDDPASRERLSLIEKQLSELREQSTQKKLRWQREKELIQAIRSLKEKMDQAHIEEQQAEREAPEDHDAHGDEGEGYSGMVEGLDRCCMGGEHLSS